MSRLLLQITNGFLALLRRCPYKGRSAAYHDPHPRLLHQLSLASGKLNLPRPLVTEKAYPKDETVWITEIDLEGPELTHFAFAQQTLGQRGFRKVGFLKMVVLRARIMRKIDESTPGRCSK